MDQQPSAANNFATATECLISEDWAGRSVVVSVSGVVDLLTSPKLEAAINATLDKSPEALIIELGDVEFLASVGMGVLVAARDRVSDSAGFAVVADGPATSRPLKLVGLADVIGLYPTLDEARAALA